MPKIKKTKKQKIQSSARKESQVDRQQEDTAPMSPTYSLQGISLNTSVKKITSAPQAATIAIKTNEYQYLSADLSKTIVLTLVIAVVELLLYFFFFRGA